MVAEEEEKEDEEEPVVATEVIATVETETGNYSNAY